MPTGAGLDAQLACVNESSVGTIPTPPWSTPKCFPFNSAELTFTPSYIDNPGIVAGKRFKDVGQVGIARKTASGKIQVPVMTKGTGWWLQYCLGSTATPTQIATSGAYKQIHTPGGLRGRSFSAQIGKPEPGTGIVQPRTYNGCKISDWTITIADNALHVLDMSVDAFNEDTNTPLVSAVYPTGNQVFSFSNVTAFTTVPNTGTQVTVASGEMAITGGVPVPSVITKLTLAGKASLADSRYGLGNSGVKKEQLENDFFDLSGSFDGEFDAATWEGVMKNNSTVALQVTSSFGDAGGGNPYLFDIIIPAAKITAAPAPVSGPDIVSVSGTFQVYDPGVTGQAPVQIKIVSPESTL